MNKTALVIAILTVVFIGALFAFLYIMPEISLLLLVSVLLIFMSSLVAYVVYAAVDDLMREKRVGKYKEEAK
ncbi:TPA: hypothetical protein OXD84_001280 [Listeria monocytogenes]|nr:hypothetical protein [Listeria monocytogenes]